MRTKTLLIAAAALAVGVATSMAQTTYSQNVVGYINVTVPPTSYVLMQDPLLYDGSYTDGGNSLSNIITGVAVNNTVINIFSGGAYTASTTYRASGWSSGGSAIILNPGTGFWLQNKTSTNQVITLVGTVPQGTNPFVYSSGYTTMGAGEPLSGLVQTTLGLPAVNNDKLYTYDPILGYNGSYTRRSASWGGGNEPVVGTNRWSGVAEAFFYSSGAGGTWNNILVVQ